MKVHPSARQVRYIKFKKKDAYKKTHLVNVCESVIYNKNKKVFVVGMQVKSASTAPCFRHSNCISNMIPCQVF